MTFRASRKREKKSPEPVAQGRQLIPSEAIKEWYYKELKSLVKGMTEDYRKELITMFETYSVKEFYTADANPISVFKQGLANLDRKWKSVFKALGEKLAENFVAKVDENSKHTTFQSLQTAGIEEPKKTYNANIEHTLEASVDFNHTLISGLQQDAHDKIYSAVMLSLTSPNPDEQGQPGILKALSNIADITGTRANLIARDQTSKIYSSLNIDRMKQNGVEKFKWMHSSAGKVPRQSHLDKDGEIFTIDDPRLWEGPKNDQGPPGWAINCRCRVMPIIDIGEF